MKNSQAVFFLFYLQKNQTHQPVGYGFGVPNFRLGLRTGHKQNNVKGSYGTYNSIIQEFYWESNISQFVLAGLGVLIILVWKP